MLTNGELLIHIIVGGVAIMFVYHLIAYFFNKEKLLLNYVLYLFFTLLLALIFSNVIDAVFGKTIGDYLLIKSKESLQIFYLTFYYNFIINSLSIKRDSVLFKIWYYFYISLILYAVVFAVFTFFILDDNFDKTVPFLISRLLMFIISLILLKKCYDLRNLTFQKFILAGSSSYFLFGFLAFYSSVNKRTTFNINDIEWLFIGSMVDIIFFALAISYRNRQKLEESIKNKILFEEEQKTNSRLFALNNTLKTLNTELIVSEENLQKSNSSKEQLISMMSHDLLNPITAITNYNQQIISRKTSNEDLLKAFKTVDAAIQPMHGLLDNMLQWTAVQKDGIAAKLKMQDVNEIVKEIISIYRPQANLKFIKINEALQDGFVIETDKSILSLILRNVLNNAIKYSANETTINISTSNKTIQIQDQGYGMTDEMIGLLNNKQLDKIEAKGTGLGLKLCYEFAEAIGAEISFKKNEKEGITIKLKI